MTVLVLGLKPVSQNSTVMIIVDDFNGHEENPYHSGASQFFNLFFSSEIASAHSNGHILDLSHPKLQVLHNISFMDWISTVFQLILCSTTDAAMLPLTRIYNPLIDDSKDFTVLYVMSSFFSTSGLNLIVMVITFFDTFFSNNL